MPSLDVLYMTRVQGERFDSVEEYERLKDSYILTTEKLENAKPDMCILHPLPRVNEISVAVDKDPRACYFKQVFNGKYMRMALILKLITEAEQGKEAPATETKELLINRLYCKNPNCITTIEQELEHIFKLSDKENGVYRCIYCEEKAKI